MINISLQGAIAEIRKAEQEYGEAKVRTAIRMALNEGLRKGRTEVRRTIQSIYSIKTSRINDPDKKKGLSFKLATKNHLEAELDIGHTPINITNTNIRFKSTTIAYSFKINKHEKVTGKKAVKRSRGFISVEIIKGQSKILKTAFAPGIITMRNGDQTTTPAIFARGKKGKPSFQFGKDRFPIAPLTTLSLYTAAVHTRAQEKYVEPVTAFSLQRIIHHIGRLGAH